MSEIFLFLSLISASKLNANPKDKLAVIESEGKLQSFVDYFSNLNNNEKNLISAQGNTLYRGVPFGIHSL